MRVPFSTPNPSIFGHSCVPMNTNLLNVLWFSYLGKSRDIVYQRTCWFSWLIFVQHERTGILLTEYSALSRLTDQGLYYIIRCWIWLLTMFHIPYIHFQRELRKVSPPKWYPSFFVQYTLDFFAIQKAWLPLWNQKQTTGTKALFQAQSRSIIINLTVFFFFTLHEITQNEFR